MPWLVILHIVALLFWFGALLYLPALIYSFAADHNKLLREVEEEHRATSMPRMVYTVLATPAALLAIASGTGVFLLNVIIDYWLLTKLATVTVLVVCHCLVGMMIWRAETGRHRFLFAGCAALGIASAGCITAILWLVLSKPWQQT